MIINCDISIFDKRFNSIKTAKLLLDVLVYLYSMPSSNFKYATNVIKVTERTLIESMSDVNVEDMTKSQFRAKERRLRYWRTRLELEGAIKYRQSNVGSYMINPLYYFNGTDKDYKSAVWRWNSFDAHVQANYFNEI